VSGEGEKSTKVSGSADTTIGNKKVGASAEASEKTTVGGGIKVGSKGAEVDAHASKEVSADANVKVNGKDVAKASGDAKGEIDGKLSAGKKGVDAEVGANGEVKGELKIGKIDAKLDISSDLKVDAGWDKNRGLHFDVSGGIHAGVDVENTKTGKSTHVGKDAEGKAGANIKKGEITTHTETKVKENAFTKILKGRDTRNNVNNLQTIKTTNKNTKINFSNEKVVSHYSTILKDQHNIINGNKQNNINKNVKTDNINKSNKENVRKNPPFTHKVLQNNSKATTNNNRKQIRRNILFKNSSKR
jgi:hypothetical protein